MNTHKIFMKQIKKRKCCQGLPGMSGLSWVGRHPGKIFGVLLFLGVLNCVGRHPGTILVVLWGCRPLKFRIRFVLQEA